MARPASAPRHLFNADFVTAMISPCFVYLWSGAARSAERLRREILLLEEFQRAGVIRHAVLLVAEGRRPFAQHRLHGDELVLVLIHQVENLVDEIVRNLGRRDNDVVEAVDLSWLLDAGEDRARADLSEVSPGHDFLGGGH